MVGRVWNYAINVTLHTLPLTLVFIAIVLAVASPKCKLPRNAVESWVMKTNVGSVPQL